MAPSSTWKVTVRRLLVGYLDYGNCPDIYVKVALKSSSTDEILQESKGSTHNEVCDRYDTASGTTVGDFDFSILMDFIPRDRGQVYDVNYNEDFVFTTTQDEFDFKLKVYDDDSGYNADDLAGEFVIPDHFSIAKIYSTQKNTWEFQRGYGINPEIEGDYLFYYDVVVQNTQYDLYAHNDLFNIDALINIAQSSPGYNLLSVLIVLLVAALCAIYSVFICWRRIGSVTNKASENNAVDSGNDSAGDEEEKQCLSEKC